MERKLILGIDFNNIVLSSYYGEKLINSKGMNVNAVKGFFFKLKSLKDTFNPDYIVLANDIGRTRTFRRKMFQDYKAQRKAMDPNIQEQFRAVHRLCALLGYPIINNELYEADDILGMISKFACDHDMDMVIVSSDRDMYQLINEHVMIFDPRKKVLIDEEYLMEQYKLTPSQWIDLKILQGDASDNIPGIKGIGSTSALSLMQRFGSIDKIYKCIDQIKRRLKTALLLGKNDINITRILVTIVTDYTKINLTESMLQRMRIFEQEIYHELDLLEIPSLIYIMRYNLIPE